MDFAATIIDLMQTLPLARATALLMLENIVIFVGSVAFGHLLVRWFGDRRVAPPPAAIEPAEVFFTISTILLNTAVTVAGLILWREGIIRFRGDLGLGVALDA